MTTVIAVDISGSVSLNKPYWDVVNNVFVRELHANTNVSYLLWDTQAEKVNRAGMEHYIKHRTGRGGTSPSCMIPILNQMTPKPERFILITDGDVCPSEVENMDEQIRKTSCLFPTVECHIVNPRPNVSVTCAFTRGNASRVWTYKYGETPELLFNISAEDVQLLHNIGEISLDSFLANYDKIHQMLLSACVGMSRGNQLYHTKLVEIKKRLVFQVGQAASAASNPDGHSKLLALLQRGDADGAFVAAQKLVNNYYQGDNDVALLSAKMDKLITLASGGVDFSIDQYKTGLAINTAGTTKLGEDDIGAGEAVDTIDLAIVAPCECPILMEDDIPVIMVLAGEPILRGVSKEMMMQIRLNPLCILQNEELCAKLKSRLGHYIGLTGFVKVFTSEDRCDPFTRNEIYGGIPLGSHPSHVTCANQTIMNMFTGGYVLGQIDLYFAILWALITGENGPAYLREIGPQMSDQMRHRLLNHYTAASLSGHMTMVSTRVPLAAAVWFVLHSGILTMEDKNRPIRVHCFQADILYNLNTLVGFPVLEFARKINRYTAAVAEIRSFAVRAGQAALDNELRSFVQKHIWAPHTSYIFLDGFVCECVVGGRGIARWMKKYGEHFSTDEILYLGSLVDVQKKMDQISFPSNETALQANIFYWSLNWKNAVVKNRWVVLEPYKELVPICRATCRPYYFVDEGKTWKESFRSMHGIHPETVTSKILSAAAMYGRYVEQYVRYPESALEFLEYCYRKQVNDHGHQKATLPPNAVKVAEETVLEFADIRESIAPGEFARRFAASVMIEDRIVIEKNL